MMLAEMIRSCYTISWLGDIEETRISVSSRLFVILTSSQLSIWNWSDDYGLKESNDDAGMLKYRPPAPEAYLN